MRAVLVGLVGAVLATAGARACNLEGASLVSDDGRTFRVVKMESHFDRLESPEVNDLKPDGYVRALIEGNGQKFLIAQSYSGWGAPNNYAQSFDFDPARANAINTGMRSAVGEKSRVDGTFAFMVGPLEGVSLRPSQCR